LANDSVVKRITNEIEIWQQQSRLEGNNKKNFRVLHCEDGGGCKYTGIGSSKGFGTNGTELTGYSTIQPISQIIFFHKS